MKITAQDVAAAVVVVAACGVGAVVLNEAGAVVIINFKAAFDIGIKLLV